MGSAARMQVDVLYLYLHAWIEMLASHDGECGKMSRWKESRMARIEWRDGSKKKSNVVRVSSDWISVVWCSACERVIPKASSSDSTDQRDYSSGKLSNSSSFSFLSF